MKTSAAATHGYGLLLPGIVIAGWLMAAGTADAQWSENFDTYAAGSQVAGQGEWQGWDGAAAAGALVSSAQAFSSPRSIAITGGSDLVHRYSGYTSGRWVFSTRQYIPSSLTSGTSYFILLNTYNNGGPYNWSIQTAFDLSAGTLLEEQGTSQVRPIVRNQWVELKYYIDLTANTVSCYYNGAFFSSHRWQNAGANAIGAVDLFANNVGPVYYDDISLAPLADLNLTLETQTLVEDSKPSGTPHGGFNRGAAWLASSTDTNTAPVTRQGVMQFTSTERDQIVVPWDADFNTTQGAVTFWIRSAGITYGGNEGAMIIDHRHSMGDVIVQDDTGVIFWQPNGLYNAHSTRTVSDGNWHHVAYIFNQAQGATVSVYIDGTLDTVAPANRDAWTWSERQIEIGLSWDPWWRVFNGELDDIRFYKRQLSPSEILLIYGGESDSTLVGASDLAGRYNFDRPPTGMRLVLTWPFGALESAPGIAGPWSTVTGAVSPYQVPDPTGNTFYRLRL
ncbi:MAG TPA: LamG domain-containing protein [Verrucomicrobiae bacterium]